MKEIIQTQKELNKELQGISCLPMLVFFVSTALLVICLLGAVSKIASHHTSAEERFCRNVIIVGSISLMGQILGFFYLFALARHALLASFSRRFHPNNKSDDVVVQLRQDKSVEEEENDVKSNH